MSAVRYWASPAAGMLCQILIFGLYAAGDALWGVHAETDSGPIGDRILLFIYGVISIPVTLYAYGYLILLRRHPGKYRLLTWIAACPVAVCSIFVWYELFGCHASSWSAGVRSFIGYFIWASGYFAPVFWAGYRYTKRNKN
ncbi:hypothetical protein [uncultured Rikenella sp.]|uniref:hypothetical protein n=1 Tax=uncultured Rikenella sp. TaxID=368003 RepID=UPI0026083317|nr:hypothetical protein [uncultured Rikenella sp.]